MAEHTTYDYDALPREVERKISDLLAQDTMANANRVYPEPKPRVTFYTVVVKRAFDIIISLLALIVSFPINLVIGIVTFFDVGRPLFFVQKRIGKGGRLFSLVKFRNMRNTRDENGNLLRADLRVTRWGRFVRSTSLDELLNFVSILKGDMSLIGPRPLPVWYQGMFNRYHECRHAVRPGLDCPLRDPSKSMTWANRLENDAWYAQNVSFTTDVMLIALLVRETLFGKDKEGRSTGFQEGSFVGYFPDGSVMDSNHIPEEYFIRAIAATQEENKVSA